jgi:hypothetical protein
MIGAHSVPGSDPTVAVQYTVLGLAKLVSCDSTGSKMLGHRGMRISHSGICTCGHQALVGPPGPNPPKVAAPAIAPYRQPVTAGPKLNLKRSRPHIRSLPTGWRLSVQTTRNRISGPHGNTLRVLNTRGAAQVIGMHMDALQVLRTSHFVVRSRVWSVGCR